MHKMFLCCIIVIGLGFSCAKQKPMVNKADGAKKELKARIKPGLKSGVDLTNLDKSVRPQDDFYRYVNGGWLDKTEIPEDRSNYGTFTMLADEAEKNLRTIVESAAAEKAPKGSDAQKVGDYYRSYLDTVEIAKRGITPLAEEAARIKALKNHDQIAAHMLEIMMLGVETPIGVFINQDAKNSTAYITYFNQSGLGLPDRDYYFSEDDRFKEIRARYQTYIEKILALAGQSNAATMATRIMRIETELAEHHWTRVKNRDRNLTYNKKNISELEKLMPDFAWSKLLKDAGLEQINEVIVRQPDYFSALSGIFKKTPVVDWRHYLLFKFYDEFADKLPADFVEASFNFYSKTLSGIEKNRPRWKRAIASTDNTLGEITGRLYVEKHFRPEAKQRMEELVDNLMLAFDEGIRGLEWMSDDTKKEALAKLGKFTTKIGYPDKWKDYSALEIKADDLIGNTIRANRLVSKREINKLGKPIDRSEWLMTPQTVNAYYNPPMNEIVFPAAILQPPFFNLSADDAANYGAIGAVIGHEISHGFDDQGRKSDGDGNLRDWWSESDATEFSKRSALMVDQYNQYNPIDSMMVNGELTLGENIGDLGGLTIAYKAYKLSLNGGTAPVIDGLTGDQRFFMGWAQGWRRKYREAELRRRIMTDPHSPSEYRVNGIVANMPEFYQAFGVSEGDGLYRAEDVRVKIW